MLAGFAHPAHRVYPYLLRGVPITRVNQVWSTDITYIRLHGGFLYLVAATRYGIEHRNDSPWALRLARLRLLAHFHRLARRVGRVDVRALRTQHIEINSPQIQPVAYHYLRASIEERLTEAVEHELALTDN